MKRRDAIKSVAAGIPLVTLGGPLVNMNNRDSIMGTQMLKGRINHAACRWPYQSIPFDDFCISIKEIGLKGIDLIGVDDWPRAKKHGLICSMTTGDKFGLKKGFNDLSLHDAL